jgi:ABC-type glutathione transport system ATPase component
LSRIKKFRESGKTLIFVSHDPAVVKNICDRAYLLSHGAIINEGHPEAIFNEYNQFIASMSAKSSRNNLPKAEAEPMQRLQIHDLRLRGENGIYTDTIVSGERCTFEVEFSSDQPSFDPIISLSIRDRMGIEIFGISNADLSTRFGAVQAKKIYRARFELKLKLGQNTYTVQAKAQTSRSASPESIAVNHSPFAFRVLLSPNNKFVGSCALDTSISFNQFDGTTL